MAYYDSQCARAAQVAYHKAEIHSATFDYDIEQYLAETGQMCETTKDAGKWSLFAFALTVLLLIKQYDFIYIFKFAFCQILILNC